MVLWRDLLEKWGLSELKISAPFVDMKFEPNDPTRKAAWELYVELLTRVATQPLGQDEGDEATALASLHSVFATTREVVRAAGPRCVELAYIAIPFLNQVLRPFTAKWHRKSLEGALATPDGKKEFRTDLGRIRKLVLGYTDLMGELSGIEANEIAKISK